MKFHAADHAPPTGQIDDVGPRLGVEDGPGLRRELGAVTERHHDVAHATEGRTNVYRGVEAPQNVAASAVRQIIERFCGVSVEQLLVGMVNDDVVDEQELRRLADRIAKRKEK